jgi:hypothetical protein
MKTKDELMLQRWAEEDAKLAALETQPPLSLLFYPRVLTESFLPRRSARTTSLERTYRNISVAVRNAEGPLPYGVLPRKFLLFCATQAIKSKSRQLVLPSERELFTMLGIPRCSKNQKSMRNQIRRLASTYIQISYFPNNRRVLEHRGMIFESIVLEQDDYQLPLFSSHIVFSETFYNTVLKTVNPFHGDMIAQLSSALSLDVFLWLSIRLPNVVPEKTDKMTFNQLYEQFAQPGERKDNFLLAFKNALDKVGEVWPQVKESVSLIGKTVELRYARDLVPL